MPNPFINGSSSEKLYAVYHGMKQRCYNPASEYYFRYGGRGIKICDEWLDSYETFRAWAMENGYEEGLSIDRIENDSDYSPTNCRWVDQEMQNNNKENNVYITYKSHRFTINKWAEITGLSNRTIGNRLYSGWPSEKILRIPPNAGFDSSEFLCWNIPVEYEKFNTYVAGVHKEITDTIDQMRLYRYIEEDYDADFDMQLGQRYDRLTLKEYVGRSKVGHKYYLCECTCGNIGIYRLDHLYTGRTTSCGCYNREKSLKHGLGDKPIYHVRHHLLDICYNPKHNDYKNYGQRGIGVCKEWRNEIDGMENFYAWAMENGYDESKSVFLLDQSADFSPENCIFMDKSLIRNFRRDAKYLTVGEYTYPLGMWLLITGHKKDTIVDRIAKGWSDEDVILTAPRGIPGVDKIEFTVPEEYLPMNCYGKMNRSNGYKFENDGRLMKGKIKDEK